MCFRLEPRLFEQMYDFRRRFCGRAALSVRDNGDASRHSTPRILSRRPLGYGLLYCCVHVSARRIGGARPHVQEILYISSGPGQWRRRGACHGKAVGRGAVGNLAHRPGVQGGVAHNPSASKPLLAHFKLGFDQEEEVGAGVGRPHERRNNERERYERQVADDEARRGATSAGSKVRTFVLSTTVTLGSSRSRQAICP